MTLLVAEGVVTGRSVLGSVHGMPSASTRRAVRTVRQHPRLHHAADQILRRSGIAPSAECTLRSAVPSGQTAFSVPTRGQESA